MKLDINCVRAILLELEGFPLGSYTPCDFKQAVSEFGIDSVEYTLKKLHEGGYINAKITEPDTAKLDFYGIFDMTFAGHEFLAKIRDTQQWATVKKGAAAIRNYSLSAISAIAEGVTAAAINAYPSANP